MKLRNSCAALAIATATLISMPLSVVAEEHHNHPYVKHEEWKKGYHMKHEDWNRGERIDYRHYHLNAPPHGYEWREVDGNYVLGAIATGVIASTVIASEAR